MTGEINPKKLKTEQSADAIVTIQTSQDLAFGTVIEDNLFYIDLQGKERVSRKLNRIFHIGDVVVLLKDIPEDDFYKGYCCSIIGVNGIGDDKTSYEIEFNSDFNEGDYSIRSQKWNPNFEFPSSNYTTVVLGKDLVRLITQDLYYKTCFSFSLFYLKRETL